MVRSLAFSLVFVILGLSGQVLANGVQPVIGNGCLEDRRVITTHPSKTAWGRVTVSDVGGGVLWQEENVLASRAGPSFWGCLWHFDVGLEETVATALLEEELYVQLELCVRRHPRDDDDDSSEEGEGGHMDVDFAAEWKRGSGRWPVLINTWGVTECDFEDPAEVVVFEPLDSPMDRFLPILQDSVAATCSDSTALVSLRPGQTPHFECSPALATAEDLANEAAARQAADAAHSEQVSDLSAALADESAARQAADADLDAALAGEAQQREAADQALEGGIAAVGVGLANLETAMMQIDARVASNSAGIASNSAGIASNQAQIAGNAAALAAHASAIGHNANGLAQAQVSIAALQGFAGNLVGACEEGSVISGFDANGVATCTPVARRLFSTTQSATNHCSYQCTGNGTHPKCGCSCSHGWGGSCRCYCASTATASCQVNSCVAPAKNVGCPNVGGIQGQSQLAECIPPSAGATGPDLSVCQGTSQVTTGSPVSCFNSITRNCSCRCGGFFPGSCSCTCTPTGTVSCTSGVGVSADAVTARARCHWVD